jgi:hypothetical protein
MRPTLLFVLLATASHLVCAQMCLDDIPPAIDLCKGTAIPIFCRSPHWKPDSVQYGTGFLLGDSRRFVTITCEHVLALKDSTGKTTAYLPLVFAHFNGIDTSAIAVRLELRYADETNDFAILTPSRDSITSTQMERVSYKRVTPSQTAIADSLREGELLLYIGYPLFLGIGKQNYPVSRVGFIAQRVKGLPFFLIDGFSQPGHSGCPVFVIHSKGTDIARTLVGITRGYPKEFSDVIQQTAFRTDTSRKAVTNPGFTVVTPMDEIMRVLRNRYGF